MALNFPASPTDGDTFVDTGSTPNVTWTYSDAGGWSRVASTIGNDEWLQSEPTTASLTVGLSTTDTTGMSGTANTLVGKANGAAIAAGKQNTSVGSGAGTVLADGDDNTLVGFNAGASLGGASADSNVFVGSGAQGAFAQATDCVVVGKDASTLASNETDAIVIGAGVTGRGSNTTVIGKSTNVVTSVFGALETSTTYTSAALPSGVAGQIIYVSDGSAAGDGIHATYNGTSWVRIGSDTLIT